MKEVAVMSFIEIIKIIENTIHTFSNIIIKLS